MKKFARFLSVLLCIVMVFSLMPWGAVSAAEHTAAVRREPVRRKGMPTQQKTIQNDGEYYTFTTFEDLQALASESYSEEVYAIYTGEGTLAISENLYLPDTMVLVVPGSMVVNSGVQFYATYLFVENLTVNGLVETIYAEVETTLDVIGTYYNHYEMHLLGNWVHHGLANVVHVNGAYGYIWYYPENADGVQVAADDAAAGDGNGWYYCISVISDMTITQSITLPWNCDLYITDAVVTVASGATLTLEGYLWLKGSLNINGALAVEGVLDLYHDAGGMLVFDENADCSGAGYIYVTASNISDPFEATPGLTGYTSEYITDYECWLLFPSDDDNTGDDNTGDDTQVLIDAYEWEVLKLTNQERLAEGLEPLTMYDLIQEATDIRAVEVDQLFEHVRPDGSEWYTVFDDVGLECGTGGENIAWGQRSAAEVVEDWMNSEGHRANILTADFAHLGVGFYNYSWVQIFTDGGTYTSIDVLTEEEFTVESGTTIDEMDLVAVLNSSVYGTCYLPVAEEYCSGYDPARSGTQTVTISVLGVSTTFDVIVDGADVPRMSGDFNNDGVVDEEDVAYLLWHTLFADSYPIDISGDINGDDMVDEADVAYLLWHTLFPDAYPL